MLKTRFTEMFGVAAPITCGGMTRVGKVELIAAVANAGALGFITAHSAGKPEDLAKAVARCRALTDRPFEASLTVLIRSSRSPSPIALIASTAFMIRLRITCCSWTRSA